MGMLFEGLALVPLAIGSLIGAIIESMLHRWLVHRRHKSGMAVS